MKLQQVRNATVILQYAKKKFVTDPWLSDKEADGWIGPTVALPLPIETITDDVDVFFVTHIHPDHFNVYGLPKDRPMYVQNDQDQQALMDLGFQKIYVMREGGSALEDVTIHKTGGVHHVTNPEFAGKVCGFVLKHPSEKTIYFAGDTVWCSDVAVAIQRHKPEIIVVNACAAEIPSKGRLIMNEEDVLQVVKSAPGATVIVSHMEAVGHATVTRRDMQSFVAEKGIASNVLIPADGETLAF